MEEKTGLKNKSDNLKLPDNNDFIDLIEEVDKSQDGREIEGLAHADLANNDEEILELNEEIHDVSYEENEDLIELTDEVPLTSQEESNKTTEIIDAAVERVIRNMFAEKIDFMVRETIKKVLAEDIEKLKQQILNPHEKKV